MDDTKVEQCKQQYPKGTRICLDQMEHHYSPVESGTKGTVDHVDDAGKLCINWDNGRNLEIITDVDKFHITEMPRFFIGHYSGGSEEIRNTYEMSKFIVDKGMTEDLVVTTEDGEPFLNTFGMYIDRIADMEYREILLKELIPMQLNIESQIFGEIDADADQNIGMEMR